jgi:molybdopterin/thiamine biosynthesis adenylyltransferase
MVHVAVIGAGGIGCAVLPRVARMPIDVLTVIDGDRVEVANLDRQSLYATADVGHWKVEVARGWLRLVSGADLIARSVFVDAANVKDLLAGQDLVLEGVDDLHAKQLIDRTCGELGIPLVSGGVHRQQGQVIVLHTTGENEGLTRSDLFAGRAGSEQDACDMREVPLDLLEEVGRVMVARAGAILRGEAVVNGRIEIFELSSNTWTSIQPPLR